MHLDLSRVLMSVVTAALLTCALSAFGAARAAAALFPATTIDGPSSAILDVDGVAMAPDGSGGLVYRKVVGGEAHVFVARFAHGAWQTPTQVDTGQPFPASFPTIAAGNGGRLLVVWAEPYATIKQITHYELMSAQLDPGAESFGEAIQIDPEDIGAGTAAFPSLSMAPNGEAYVVYRVVSEAQTLVALRPGDQQIEVRVARFNGLNWSSLGAINRSPFVAMRQPTASNAPAIATDRVGTGAVVVWQEPDVGGVARIWARRIFGTTLGNVLPVSAETANGKPISTDADAPSVSVSTFDEAKVAYRLSGGPGSPYVTPHMFINTLPSSVGEHASQFTGPVAVDAAPTLGTPSISLDNHGEFRMAYTANGATRALTGTEAASTAPATLGAAAGEPALTTIDADGGGVTAWPATGSATAGPSVPVLDVRDELPSGASQQAQLAAPLSGPLDGVALGGSYTGDALLGFRQGPPGQAQVMGAVAQAPPADFLVTTPVGWVKGASTQISWEAASDALGHPTYSVLVDGHLHLRNLSKLSTKLSLQGLGDGLHHVQVRAADASGQQTTTASANLKVDTTPPRVSVSTAGAGTVIVRVFDRASGVRTHSVAVVLGDGSSVHGKLTVHHTYAHPGHYVITVASEDNVGNSGVVHVRVNVR